MTVFEACTRIDLGYGIGTAYGYATLGIIGFEGRNDYKALGSVVNLASRLCGEAGSGEVLIDFETAEALAQRVTVAGYHSRVSRR